MKNRFLIGLNFFIILSSCTIEENTNSTLPDIYSKSSTIFGTANGIRFGKYGGGQYYFIKSSSWNSGSFSFSEYLLPPEVYKKYLFSDTLRADDIQIEISDSLHKGNFSLTNDYKCTWKLSGFRFNSTEINFKSTSGYLTIDSIVPKKYVVGRFETTLEDSLHLFPKLELRDCIFNIHLN